MKASRVAYSYQRFSSPEQAEGDSLRRQTAKARNWCKENGYTLDPSTYKDKGVSAFKGKNAIRGKLGLFLEACKRGKIQKGAVLLVENLDRLSRQGILEASVLLRDILEYVDIVTLIPTPRRLTKDADEMEVLICAVDLARGKIESQVKSDRLKEKWDERRRLARKERFVCTGHAPAWLEKKKGERKFKKRPDKIALVNRIFKMALTVGSYQIAHKLNQEAVPTLGKARTWDDTAINSLLRNRRVLGEYQPCNDKRQPQGDPIADYYPQIVKPDLFYRVQQKIDQRRHRPGRQGNGVVCLFSGLWYDAADKARWQVLRRTVKMKTYAYLRSANAERGVEGATTLCFNYTLFEDRFLFFIHELRLSDLQDHDETPDETLEELSGKLADTKHRIRALQARIEQDDDFISLVEVLHNLEARYKDLKTQMEFHRGRQHTSPSKELVETQSVIEALKHAQGDRRTDLRRRLKAHICEFIEAIYVLVYEVHGGKAADVQVNFTSGDVKQFLVCDANGYDTKEEGGTGIVGDAWQYPIGKLRPHQDLSRYNPKKYKRMHDLMPSDLD